ncbi:MBL fold metallo-hydrolase [Natronomonas salina]|uniref:MBL fold metallo-hydrolase n=1 Tax=Natronomonas salina TaxID=1710540 RepID=UPI0015B49D49|nr:MBL fold metallo-hydrolase [Natronomonas salina]QLD88059.1 MBL fold metallo-hydrolase [Natronomonas salina]
MAHTSAQAHRIEFDIPWPPHTAYAYLVPAAEPVLIDAGTPGEDGWAALVDGLAEAGYDPEDVDHLLVTHPHTDHDGQAAELVDVADPTVYAPVGVRERLARDSDDLAAAVRANATEVGLPDVDVAVEESVDSLHRNRSCLPPEEIDVDLPFGDRFAAGEVTFEPIHVPGHQIDQAAYLADGQLFAGDALVEPFRPAALHTGFDRGCYDCVDAFYEGLDRLAGYDVDRVHPGHGPVFEDAAGAIERARADLDALVEDVESTLSDIGEATAYGVTDERIDDPRRMQFSVFESLGALARLERQGEIDSRLDGDVRRYVA